MQLQGRIGDLSFPVFQKSAQDSQARQQQTFRAQIKQSFLVVRSHQQSMLGKRVASFW